MKESGKIVECLDLSRELKDMERKGGCCSFNGLQEPGIKTGDQEIRERNETIQTTALLKSTQIRRRVLKNIGDLLS